MSCIKMPRNYNKLHTLSLHLSPSLPLSLPLSTLSIYTCILYVYDIIHTHTHTDNTRSM